MKPNDAIRALVSVPKKGYYDVDSFLDLSYVTPRIIVAAGPSDTFVSNLFRSPIDQVVAHLNRYKSGNQTHWHIWNLRGEEPGYKKDQISPENWSYFPFPDHSPPSITLLIAITKEIHEFFSISAKNVALIHCKEGKGRSGTICCAYLMYEASLKGVLMSVEEAIATFTRRRMRKFFGSGVSISSQVKYLTYWKSYLSFSDIMKQNLVLYHSLDEVSFDSSRSLITKLTVVRPTSLLILSKFKLSTYDERNENHSLQSEDLTTKSLRFPDIRASSAYLEVPLNIPITPRIKDIKLSFERQFCIAYTWFNLFFETLAGKTTPLPDHTGNSLISKRLIIPWEHFDGFRGTKISSGIKLFEAVEILWVFHYHNTTLPME